MATIAVAMSGGVDSSVAAALLQEAGHEVVGIMLRLWSEPGASPANKCCTLGAIDDARDVAAMLGIPFSVLDAEEPFLAEVVEPFVSAAMAGETPNPCFLCNRAIRFGFLLRQARALGADALATGHYARVRRAAGGSFELLRGVDHSKDQSYVLHRLNQDQLARAVFPVGGMLKADVRAVAARFGLPVAARKDSVDLCWIGADGVGGFLRRRAGGQSALEPGPIQTRDGRRLGTHAGLALYTEGQRRGLGIAASEPLFVLERDLSTGTLVVGPEAALAARHIAIGDLHWVAGAPPGDRFPAEARIRYGSPGAAARVELAGDGAVVSFDAPQRAPSPGQGLVLYDGESVLGGGRIRRTLPS